jgi:hypothetical protein
MSKYNFIKLRNCFHVITTPGSTPRYITFSKPEVAMKYRDNLIEFHKKFKCWPMTNFDEDKYKLGPKDDLYDYSELEISTIDEQEVVSIMQVSGTGLLHCIEFELGLGSSPNKYNMRIRGQNVDVEPDIEVYYKNLDYNIRNDDDEWGSYIP